MVARAEFGAPRTGPRQADRVISPVCGGARRACRGCLQAVIRDRSVHVDVHNPRLAKSSGTARTELQAPRPGREGPNETSSKNTNWVAHTRYPVAQD